MSDDAQLKHVARASEIARVAMGRLSEKDPARKQGVTWTADADPLAWWCLTELIANSFRPHAEPRT